MQGMGSGSYYQASAAQCGGVSSCSVGGIRLQEQSLVPLVAQSALLRAALLSRRGLHFPEGVCGGYDVHGADAPSPE